MFQYIPIIYYMCVYIYIHIYIYIYTYTYILVRISWWWTIAVRTVATSLAPIYGDAGDSRLHADLVHVKT